MLLGVAVGRQQHRVMVVLSADVELVISGHEARRLRLCQQLPEKHPIVPMVPQRFPVLRPERLRHIINHHELCCLARS